MGHIVNLRKGSFVQSYDYTLPLREIIISFIRIEWSFICSL